MTVYIEKPAVNLREELASLRNQGGYQEQQFYFDSLVTNGTFDADTSGWSGGFSWVDGTFIASGGIATLTRGASDGTSPRFVTALTGLTIGAVYRITFDEAGATGVGDRLVSWGSGSNGVGGVALNQVTVANWTNETKEFFQTATATTMYLAFAMVNPNVGDTGSIDNVSVFEVDANDDVIHTMPKGWKPKDVFEDGLLQREGTAHDYEVVYDGFDYVVKPTVAPSATTQTCVIGVKA